MGGNHKEINQQYICRLCTNHFYKTQAAVIICCFSITRKRGIKRQSGIQNQTGSPGLQSFLWCIKLLWTREMLVFRSQVEIGQKYYHTWKIFHSYHILAFCYSNCCRLSLCILKYLIIPKDIIGTMKKYRLRL